MLMPLEKSFVHCRLHFLCISLAAKKISVEPCLYHFTVPELIQNKVLPEQRTMTLEQLLEVLHFCG